MEKELVLITGGSGYIGSSIIQKIADRYHVIVLDTQALRTKSPNVDYYKFDITSEENLSAVFKTIKTEFGGKIRSVIHLAGFYDFNGKEDLRYQTVNVDGTRSLLKHLKENFELAQFVFASSMLVYAPSLPGIKLTESSRVDPGWAYPQSKVECEQVIKELHGDTQAVILRIAAVYNDYGYAPSIGQQVYRIFEMQLTSFLFPGNRNHIQSGIHVEDLAEAIALTIDKKEILPHEITLSLGEDETPTYAEIQRDVSRLIHHRELPLFFVPKFIAWLGAHALSVMPGTRASFIRPWMIKYSDANYDMDNTKIKEFLGWTPKRNLRETLPKIVHNLLSSPASWYRKNKIPSPPPMRARLIKKLGAVS